MPVAYVERVMAAIVISPTLFVEHATRLRARKLEQIAATLKAESREKPGPRLQLAFPARRDLSTVLREFRSRLR